MLGPEKLLITELGSEEAHPLDSRVATTTATQKKAATTPTIATPIMKMIKDKPIESAAAVATPISTAAEDRTSMQEKLKELRKDISEYAGKHGRKFYAAKIFQDLFNTTSTILNQVGGSVEIKPLAVRLYITLDEKLNPVNAEKVKEALEDSTFIGTLSEFKRLMDKVTEFVGAYGMFELSEEDIKKTKPKIYTEPAVPAATATFNKLFDEFSHDHGEIVAILLAAQASSR